MEFGYKRRLFITKLINYIILLVIASLISGCNANIGGNSIEANIQGQNYRSNEIRGKVEKAYVIGINLIMNEPVLSIGEIWALQQILKFSPDKTLRTFVDGQISNSAGNRFERLVNSKASRFRLPDYPGSGFDQLYIYILAAFGTPESRAISFIHDFLSEDEDGYILTHQLLVLEWAKQSGLQIPEELRKKKTYLLDRIYREQRRDRLFSDLYAERNAILFLFSYPNPKDAGKWVLTTLNAQLPNGGWGLHSREVSYNGQKTTLSFTARHTLALVLLTLRLYLKKY